MLTRTVLLWLIREKALSTKRHTLAKRIHFKARNTNSLSFAKVQVFRTFQKEGWRRKHRFPKTNTTIWRREKIFGEHISRAEEGKTQDVLNIFIFALNATACLWENSPQKEIGMSETQNSHSQALLAREKKSVKHFRKKEKAKKGNLTASLFLT